MCPSTETSPSFQKKNVSCFCNRKPGSQHDIPPGIMSVFSPASLPWDLVIQLQDYVTGTGNQQSNPKTLSFPQSLTVKHSLCVLHGSGDLLRVIVELSLSSPIDIFMLPPVMLCPPLPLLRQDQNSLHICSLSVLPIPCVSSLEVKTSTLWTVFLKKQFFPQIPLFTAKLESR